MVKHSPLFSPPAAMTRTDIPEKAALAADTAEGTASDLTGELLRLRARRKRRRTLARTAARTLGRELGEEGVRSLATRLPFGAGVLVSGALAAADIKKARVLGHIAADPMRTPEEQARARREAALLRRSARLELAGGAAATLPGLGTVASLAVGAASAVLETRDRAALEEDGGSVLDKRPATPPRSLDRALEKVNEVVLRQADELDAPERVPGRTR